MSYLPELTPVQKICGTSVDCAQYEIDRTTDAQVIRDCIEREESSQDPRKTLLRALRSKLRKLERQLKK